ncbi:MAG: hypothetical protein AAFY16_01700 [Cyanobacteria bacterium J06642_3]
MTNTSENSSTRINPNDEYREAMESIRHYSKLRFTQLTVYSAINAALIYTVFQSDLTHEGSPYRLALCIVGIAFAVIFLWLELVLDAYKCSFMQVVEELSPNGHWTLRPKRLGILVRTPVRVLYLLPCLFWIYILIVPPPL